ncbi:hypothetical protein NE237_010062 [Protea cynaroides]|uniref:HMG box domain-containing protein n=1 Tax=Protea cynaroides TaxID=273540 RepID=A0A9Q0KYK9_9MAGN|nr:hypothetical protein NE237_010062 [Protea cynaroides]
MFVLEGTHFSYVVTTSFSDEIRDCKHHRLPVGPVTSKKESHPSLLSLCLSFSLSLWFLCSALRCCVIACFTRPYRSGLSKQGSFSKMKAGKGKGAAKDTTREALKPVDDRKVGKRKAPVKADKGSIRQAKKEKAPKKDPNKPKRPASAFFVFLEEFRKTYKQDHPNVKAVSAVGKAGGEKWKSLTVAEKAPYEAKAAKRKSDYEKLMSAYTKKQESMADDNYEESDRSRSEVHDDDEEESAEEEEDDDEDDD